MYFHAKLLANHIFRRTEEQDVEFLRDPTVTSIPQHCPHRKQTSALQLQSCAYFPCKMDSDDASSTQGTPEWVTHTRTLSDGSSSTSTEQLALMGFAHRLYSVSSNNDAGIADEIDVRNEAKLLMSLSGIPPTSIDVESGRITPPSDASSCHSMSSRQRDTFRFSCPSLSLENSCHGDVTEGESSFSPSRVATEIGPAALLSRVLKVEDVDALRLTSEAMARNILQSYEKAIQWRIQSWIACLSRILVRQEGELKRKGTATEENLKVLRESSEAMLIVRLREIGEGMKVIDACNHFNVLPQKVQSSHCDRPHKRRRLSEDLSEGEYEYTVSHVLALEININVRAPSIGSANIDMKVPGTMNGTFVSFEDGRGKITDVVIDINTHILASMIEKSSRILVRSAMEALLKGEEPNYLEEEPDETSLDDQIQQADHLEGVLDDGQSLPEDELPIEYGEAARLGSTPLRTLSVDRVSDLVFVTPRDCDSSRSSSTEESDNDEQPSFVLSIPNDFDSDNPKQTLVPQPSRSYGTSRLPMNKINEMHPPIVTPSKTSYSFIEGDGEAMNLPTLVEVALQLYAK